MEIEKSVNKIWAVCWKDIKIYYAKGPVIIIGVLFPLFLWLSFYAGKGLNAKEGMASLLALTLFFTSSSVTPTIPPWETRQRTIEMLLTRPITIREILIGDVMASTIFGLIFALFSLIIGIILGAMPSNMLLTIVIIVLMSFGFSALGVLFSALPSDTPADVILISNVVKLPLIFISGVLIPIKDLPKWMLPVAFISPLTYPTDLLRILYIGNGYFSVTTDFVLTVIFSILFLLAALKLHEKTIFMRLQRR